MYVFNYIISGLWLWRHSTRGAVGQALWSLVCQEEVKEVGGKLISEPRGTLGGRHPIRCVFVDISTKYLVVISLSWYI